MKKRSVQIARCGICGEKMPPKGRRFFFTLGLFGGRRSKERFCSGACAETEREHVVDEIEEGLISAADVTERRKTKTKTKTKTKRRS